LKLTLLLPTYNRPNKFRYLLDFINKELSSFEKSVFDIEIIVGDNSSDDLTQHICENSILFKKGLLSYVKNVRNIGLIDNVTSLIRKGTGYYTWILGDDDFYHEGIFKKVHDTIHKDNFSYIFLNHRAYIKGKENESGFRSAVDLNKKDTYDDGKDLILDVWGYSQSTLMFISASVCNTKILKECLQNKNKLDITFPLYISFYCGAKGKGKIIKDIYIDNIWGTTSWQNVKSKVFNYYLPNNLYLLPKLGYNYFTSRRMLIMYLIQRIKLESSRFFSIIKFSLK
jgi:hypothetical protein